MKAEHIPLIVSFDFDSTLQLDVLDEDGDAMTHAPNDEIIEKVWDHHERGNKVILVTTRLDKFMDEVREFVLENKLPILPEDIHNTNMDWKRNTLKRLKVDIHFDDNPDELRRIRHSNTRGILVETPPLNDNSDKLNDGNNDEA
jgi:acid phosphatase class B